MKRIQLGSRFIASLLTGMMLSLLSLSAWALTPTLIVSEGETVSFSGDLGETISGQSGTCQNRNSRYIEVQGDATFVVTANGSAERGFFCAFIVSSGTATLDLTQLPADLEFRFDCGLVAKEGGRLVVKGRDHVELGGLYSSSGANFAAPADCPNISFVDEEDVPYGNPFGLRLCHRFLEVSLPTTVPWSVAPASTAVVYYASSQVFASLKQGNRIEMTDFDLWVDHNSLLDAETTVVVPPGREFAIQPRTLQLPSASSTYYYDFYGPSYSDWSFNVELGGVGAVFNLRNHHNFLHGSGSITGIGSFRHTATANQNNTIRLEGTYPFSGSVSLETTNPLEIKNQASLGADGNVVTAVAGAVLKLGTATSAMRGTLGAVMGPLTGAPASIIVGKNTALTVGEVTGLVGFEGSGRDVSSVAFSALPAGGRVVNVPEDTVAWGVVPELMAQVDVISLLRSDGLNAFYRKLSSDESVDLSRLGLAGGAEYKVVARDGESFMNVPDNVRLEIPNGIAATLASDPKSSVTSSVHVAEGGMATLAVGQPDWRSKLLCVFDPSDGATIAVDDQSKISSIADANGGNVRLNYQSATTSTWPLWQADGPNGLHYVSCRPSDNSRMNCSEWISPKFAIMVFGSQNGGGQALFATGGTSSGAYARGGTDLGWDTTKAIIRPSHEAAILATNGIPVWVDGESVDPMTTGLSGGWQVLSLETTIASVIGIGYRTANSYDASGVSCGNGVKFTAAGQNYGEVLFFREMPTTEERQAAERYLAGKWGIEYKGPEVGGVSVAAYGKGTVRLGAAVELLGSFKGIVDLNGHEVRLPQLPRPPEAATAVPSGLLAWFDPNETSKIEFTDTVRVNKMFRCDGTKADGEKYLDAVGRQPLLRNSARGDGPALNWLFYSPYEIHGAQVDSSGKGRALRFYEWGLEGEKPLNCKTVIMVQDSAAGGGTPFLEDKDGKKSFGRRFAARSEDAENPEPRASDPIWKGNSVATMAAGVTYLDGMLVDGSTVGFNGRPEVLAVTRADGFNVGFFADLYYQNSMTNLVEYGEIQGEILMFESALSDAQIKDLDAYLAWKWLGVARPGYAVSSGMTLSGVGCVTGVKMNDLPAFAQGFSGAVELADTDYSFTIAPDGTVLGKIAMPTSTLTFPPICTAHVTVQRGVRPGDYVLAEAGALSGETTWAVDGTSTKILDLKIIGNQLVLSVEAKGMSIVIR